MRQLTQTQKMRIDKYLPDTERRRIERMTDKEFSDFMYTNIEKLATVRRDNYDYDKQVNMLIVEQLYRHSLPYANEKEGYL